MLLERRFTTVGPEVSQGLGKKRQAVFTTAGGANAVLIYGTSHGQAGSASVIGHARRDQN